MQRNVRDLRREGLVGGADAELSYAAPDVLTWPEATAPQELTDSAADLVLSTNGLSR